MPEREDACEERHLTERPEDTVRRYARRLVAIEELHAERHRDVDGYTLRWCRECGQNWPCPTIEAVNADG